MSNLIRVWKELDIQDVEKHLIVMGDLSAECFACHKIDVDVHSSVCPDCGTGFKYMGFRRQISPGYLARKKEEFSHLVFIDFEDFKKCTGKRDARKLLDI